MSTRTAVSATVIVVAGLAVGLRHYLRRDPPTHPTPSVTATVPEPEARAPAAEPSPPPPQLAQPKPLDDVAKRVEQTRADLPSPPARFFSAIASVGGEEIPLREQEAHHQPGPIEIDDGKSGGFFEPLAAAAREGNDSAARALFEALHLCKYYPKTRAEFDAGQKKTAKWFEQTGGVVTPGEKPKDLDAVSKDFEGMFHRCEGVTDDMYMTATDLLRESVERGSDDSRLVYAGALSDDSRLVYAHSIASTDPKEADAQYAILWQHGYLAGLGGLAKDSLPHRIASLAAAAALFDPDLPTPFAHEKLKALEASTSPSTFQEASKEAAQILKNPNCCKL